MTWRQIKLALTLSGLFLAFALGFYSRWRMSAEADVVIDNTLRHDLPPSRVVDFELVLTDTKADAIEEMADGHPIEAAKMVMTLLESWRVEK